MAKQNGSKDTRFAHIKAVILAGGLSSRMGTDKARLLIRGVPLLDHMISRVGEALDYSRQEIFVSGARDGYQCIPDAPDSGLQQGPLAGVIASLRTFLTFPERERPKSALFVPVDMPLLSIALLQEICLHLDALPPSVLATAFGGSELPFACRVEAPTLQLASALLDERIPSSRSVRGFLEKCGAARIKTSWEQKNLFLNANTPADWSRLHL